MYKIGFLGLGRVGSILSKGLKEHGFIVKGYDKLGNIPSEGDPIREHCQREGVEWVESPKLLVESVDWIIAVTSPKLAIETAESVAAYLTEGQIYMDFNSATPEVKEQVTHVVAPASFIDGVILEFIGQYGHRVPVVLSGRDSGKVADVLREGGMNVKSIGEIPGQASAYKASHL